MTVTVTPTVNPSANPPSISLAVSSTTETATTIRRVNPDGSLVAVRTTTGGALSIPSHSGTLVDYEAPFGAPVSYTSVESPATVSGQVTLAVSKVWLIHPGVPALSVPIQMRRKSLTAVTYTAARGVFKVLGDPYPIVVTDGSRKAAGSALTALVTNAADLSALLTLLNDSSTLLLNVPANGYTFGSCYISVGDVTTGPSATDLATDPYIDVTIPFDVTRMPVGGSTSTRTYATVEAQYATYTTAEAAYATYAAATAGP